MAGIEDRWRRFVVDGEPVVAGVLPVADSLAATNPTLGRGISLGLRHAIALRDRVRTAGTDDPVALAAAFDADTQAVLTPWYRSTRWWDGHRIDDARRAMGTPVPVVDDPLFTDWQRVVGAFLAHPALMDAFFSTLRLERRPEEVAADPAVRAVLDEIGAVVPPPAGPDRAEVLRLVGA
jgi:hypothetical protein